MIKALGKKLFRRFVSPKRFAKKIGCPQVNSHALYPSTRTKIIFDAMTPTHTFSAGTEDYIHWKDRARQELRNLLGVDRLPQEEVTSTTSAWQAHDDVASIEKLYLETSQRRLIPVYIGTPLNNPTPREWLISIQGHTSGMHVSLGMDASEQFYERGSHSQRNFGQIALLRGFGVLCIELESLGEMKEANLRRVAPHPCFDASMQSLLLGVTLMGRRITDIFLATDYLRACISGDARLLIGGNSLGGSVSLFAAALSDRFNACLPSCCISDFQDSILGQYHCADLYVPALARSFQMSDILGLVAPRLLIPAAGITDPLFPITGFRNTLQGARATFFASGAAGSLKPVIGMGGHRLYAAEMLNRYQECS